MIDPLEDGAFIAGAELEGGPDVGIARDVMLERVDVTGQALFVGSPMVSDELGENPGREVTPEADGEQQRVADLFLAGLAAEPIVECSSAGVGEVVRLSFARSGGFRTQQPGPLERGELAVELTGGQVPERADDGAGGASSLVAMLVFLVGAVAVDISGRTAGTLVVDGALIALGAVMVWHAERARRVPSRAGAAFVGHVGFTLVGLVDAFAVLTIFNAGAPGWTTVAVGVVIAVAGHHIIGRARVVADRADISSESPRSQRPHPTSSHS